MTRLLIDLSDVLDQTHPDDAVTVWAPTFREGARGQLVQRRRQKISLVDGKGEATVEPGPLMVQIYSPGARQNDATRLVIPDQPEVTLTAVMEEHFVYTPEVMGVIGALREAALVSETNAATSATAAAASETNAATSETSAATSATTSDDAAATAVAALVAAEQEAQEAAAATAMQFIGTGFPNGVVAAPVGSIYTDTAATAGAVRWIKANGAGNTGWEVEYGDTGKRRVDGLFPEFDCTTAGHHGIFVRRVGPAVYFYGTGLYRSSDVYFGPGMHTLVGRPDQHYVAALGVAMQAGNPSVRLIANGSHSIRLNFNEAPYNNNNSVAFNVAYTTSNPWPTTLPGDPA